ncbi:hypothetical protein BU25DRAFT_89210 [Macroventuria anomochaeta]|uniref:Uncharacterized protein n=1 Tax=Macroventuria anomochaeta TaxID=301207 RepID=A0ACB6SFM3_9PLEO|nr:uncharacterized protein BU25DRAFT_89210 [Macroventuria anomochaeta]KAF2633126.1 hypothetical protein BU25DRAFT_89210 [Macroventuria anomochaeta]
MCQASPASAVPHLSLAFYRPSDYTCSDQTLLSKMQCEQGLKETLTGLRDIVIGLIAGLHLNDLPKLWVLTHICAVLTEAEQQPNNLPKDFLHELQILCRWQQAPTGHPHEHCDIDTEAWLCCAAQEHANDGFWKYASASMDEREGLQYFRTRAPLKLFMDFQEHDLLHILETSEGKDALEDLPRSIANSLHTALSKYAKCACPGSEASSRKSRQHEARLCLVGRPNWTDSFANNDLHVFSSSTVQVDSSICQWQQLRIQIAHTRPLRDQTGELTLTGTSPEERETVDFHRRQAMTREVESAIQPGGGFCELLRKSSGSVRMILRLKDQSLAYFDGETPQQRLRNEPSISLAEVMSRYALTRKMKLALAFTLARSMWQYYDSEWTKREWSAESIHFMTELKAPNWQTTVITCRPSLMTSFTNVETHKLVEEYADLRPVCHNYPRILALGLLLVRIGWDDHIPFTNHSTSPAMSQRKLNDECSEGHDMCEESSWPRLGPCDPAGDNIRKRYKAATEACFDNKALRTACSRYAC